MGIDLRFKLKKDIKKKEVAEIGMDRRFCNLIANAKYGNQSSGDRSDFDYLEEILEMDLSRLLKLEYVDPEQALYWAELAGIQNVKGLRKDAWLSQKYMKVEEFYSMIEGLLNTINSDLGYFEKIKYLEFNGWGGYFENDFIRDLEYLMQELEEKRIVGFKWISIEIDH